MKQLKPAKNIRLSIPPGTGSGWLKKKDGKFELNC